MIDISVVIPTHARQHLLRRALDSVVGAASHAGLTDRIETVVVDDEASDATRDLVQAVPRSIPFRYVRHPGGPRKGPAAARNQGVKASQGRFLFWLDDDDEFLPNRFEKCLPLLEGAEVDGVFEVAERERQRPDGSIENYTTGPGRSGADADPFRFLLTEPEAGHIATGATSFTRESFDRAGGLDEALDYGEDGEFLIRLALHSRIALITGAPVARIHRHATNLSHPSGRNYWGSLKSMRASYKNNFWNGKESQRQFLASQIAGKLDFALTRCRLDYGRSRRYREGLRALRYSPWTCLSTRNLRSIVVWLLWPRPAAPDPRSEPVK